jgi:hypothetical protein
MNDDKVKIREYAMSQEQKMGSLHYKFPQNSDVQISDATTVLAVSDSGTKYRLSIFDMKDEYPDDVRQLVYRLDIIKRDGAMDRHFRYEGTKHDRVMALPSHLETTSLRLYLLNIQAKILILGNGGLKHTATYQEDDNLHRQVKTLQKIDIELKRREKDSIITVSGTELFGELSFNIKE